MMMLKRFRLLLLSLLGTSSKKKRTPTKTNPRKFQQSEGQPVSKPTNDASTNPEPKVDMPKQSEEDTAYRREFAQRYGIGADLMDESSKEKKEDNWTPQSLNY